MAIVNTIPHRGKNAAIHVLNRAFLALFAQRDRWGLWLPVPLAVGIGIYFGLPYEPAPWAALAVFVAGVLGVWARRGRYSMLAWLCVAIVALGFLAAYLRTHGLDTPLLKRESGPVVIAGTIKTVDALPKALRVTITDAQLRSGWLKRGDQLPHTVRVKLKNKDTSTPAVGDSVEVRAILLPLSAPVAPNAFDFQRHAYFQGLGATGYAIGDLVITNASTQGGFFDNLRHAIRRSISMHIDDRDTAGVVTAFLIGESKAISEATWEQIRRSGIAHLLAISGFHITVVTGAFFFLVRALLALWPWAALHWPIKKISAVFAIAGSVFYLLLIGSPITAERAVIMACVVMIAIMLDRDPFSLRLAAFAACALLLVQPEALIGPSFQMSFAAVVALIAFYESIARSWVQAEQHSGLLHKAGVYLLACLLTTLVATAATAPYTLYHFGQVPVLAGLVSNMIAVPISSLITLPFGIVACLLMPFGLEAAPLWVAEQSMVVIMDVVSWTAAWDHAVVMANAFDSVWLVVATIGLLWLCIWRDWWRWLGIVPVIVACACAWLLTQRPAVLISDNGRQAMIRDEEERLWLQHARREKFIATAWLEREGAQSRQKPAGTWQDAADAGVMRCDAKACIFKRDEVIISLVTMPEAVAEDCDTADVFIAPQAKLSGDLCPQKRRYMIDQDDLRYRGAHAVYTRSGRVKVERVADQRGQRPWVAGYQPD